jgi:hypothetical protein
LLYRGRQTGMLRAGPEVLRREESVLHGATKVLRRRRRVLWAGR